MKLIIILKMEIKYGKKNFEKDKTLVKNLKNLIKK